MENRVEQEKPREKAIRLGFSCLSDEELLSLILRTGHRQENVFALARQILYKFDGLSGLNNIGYSELTSINGIKEGKACAIMATIEFARRLKSPIKTRTKFSLENVYNYIRPILEYRPQEYFVIIFIDKNDYIQGYRIVSVGTLNLSVIHPRDVFRDALTNNVYKIVLAHNHPSGIASPSEDDIATTIKMIEIGKMLDIYILDHIIIGHNQYFSLKQHMK